MGNEYLTGKARRDHLTQLSDAEERGLERGLKKGREAERQEVYLNLAKKMKTNGEDPAKITLYTGLSSEEIENL